MKLQELAVSIATKAHSGQVDKAGSSYIKHPLLIASAFGDEPHIVVALLHDVVEDTDITLAQLTSYGFASDMIQAIDAITRRQDESYVKYLTRVKANPIARDVKLADLRYNMDLSRISHPTQKDYTRLKNTSRRQHFLKNRPSSVCEGGFFVPAFIGAEVIQMGCKSKKKGKGR
jgi:guanosine-3',5'-bis(diphosphate) 3'-pyrophosphohydrolase